MNSRFLKSLWPYVAEHRSKIIGSVILSLVLAVLKGLQAYLVKPIFDKGLSDTSSLSEAAFLAGVLFLLMLVNFPARFFHFYWIRYVVEHATCGVRADLFKKIQRFPMTFLNEKKQGLLISNMVNDTQIFSQGFRGAMDLVREPLTALLMLGLALYRDWQLTLIIFAVAPLFVIIFGKSGKKVKNHQHHVQEEMGQMTHNIGEGIVGHKIIKSFGLQNFSFLRFLSSQQKFFIALMKTTRVEEIAHPMVELVGGIAFSGIIIFAHYRISSGALTTGDFVSFVTAMALFMDPVRKYSQANIKINQARAAGERIFSLLNTPEELDSGKHEITSFQSKIQIKNLSFSYGQHQVIDDLSLEIKKGEKVAFVGLSGSGKSTLINLFLGLYPVAPGHIFIDGVDISDIKLASLRHLFGPVSQDIFLFNDTIKVNLQVGVEYSEDQLQHALQVSYADEFVAKLPNGLETLIGDRGTRLSGGQQQRLTIARAFLKNPDIYLFDEATSALDNESEKIVQMALQRAGGDKTVIAVAHRLSTIQDFDRIYVMHSGKIVEYGTHNHLISLNGEYSKLYQLTQ